MSNVLPTCLPRAYGPILKLWTLRLIKMGGGILAERRNRADLSREALDLAGFRRLEPWGRQDDPIKKVVIQMDFLDALAKAEAKGTVLPARTALARNIAWLGSAAGLSPVDQAIIHMVVLAAHHPGLENALDQLGALSLGSLQALFAKVLDFPVKAVARALDSSGALARTGLVHLDSDANYAFRGKIELLPGLADRLTLSHTDPTALFKGAFLPGPKATLDLGQYPHLSKELDILVPYLRAVLAAGRKGVNILIYGTSGSGKTQLVRALAGHLGANLVEVAAQRANGAPVEGDERFRGYRLAQAVVGAHPNQLVLLDEIEDVFRTREDVPRAGRNNVSGVKGWVTRVLEENPAPAFWVGNHIQILDEAFIRRFDFVVRLDNPPRSVRRRMLELQLDGLPLESRQKDLLAEHQGLSPAIITKAAQVLGTVHRSAPQLDSGQVLNQILGNTLEALGQPRSSRQGAEWATRYRPELVNTDLALAPVLAGLAAHRQGRLCFYGPPGTGKTAYGWHLALALDRPLIVKRASDLLNPWLGGTEKNMAQMFEEAAQEDAVLLLDEADSFLQSRSGAQRNFEVTQTNEMLCQLESFKGVFIASTNLMEKLDTAALRRFDLKVRFDYLRPEQAWVMFQDLALGLGLTVPPGMGGIFSGHSLLTPGDFATVARQARLSRPGDARELFRRLEQECQLKPETRRKPIGFVDRAS